jgi:hypothetical protein
VPIVYVPSVSPPTTISALLVPIVAPIQTVILVLPKEIVVPIPLVPPNITVNTYFTDINELKC